jgi:hypothetical protein
MFLQVRMSNKFRIYAYLKIILALAKLFCTGPHYFRLVQIGLDRSKKNVHQLLQTNHKLHWEMFLQVRMPNKFRIYAYFQIILALAKLFCTGWHYFRLVQIILDWSKLVWTGRCFFYNDKSQNSERYPFANVKSVWQLMWKMFCHSGGANSSKNVKTCNLHTGQSINYKSVN